MLRFGLIMISFGFLGVVFYEMSGGDEFDAEALRLSRVDAEELPAQPRTKPSRLAAIDTTDTEVTRVSLNLTTLQDVVAPQRTIRTTPARQTSAADPQPEAEVIAASATATNRTGVIENPRILVPSLIQGATPEAAGVTITPVDLSGAASATEERDVRAVTGNSVNVRGGPGTGFSVVNRLRRGDEVVILEDPGDGWVMMRPVEGGPVGWMADFLLTDAG
ncbi:MAG: SH3 domain-containing protein [Pseudomonadota bacterium]